MRRKPHCHVHWCAPWRRYFTVAPPYTERELLLELLRVHRNEYARLLLQAAWIAQLGAGEALAEWLAPVDLPGEPELRRRLLAEFAFSELDGFSAPPELEALAVQPLAVWPDTGELVRQALGHEAGPGTELAAVRVLLAGGSADSCHTRLERLFRAGVHLTHRTEFYLLLALTHELLGRTDRAAVAWQRAEGASTRRRADRDVLRGLRARARTLSDATRSVRS